MERRSDEPTVDRGIRPDRAHLVVKQLVDGRGQAATHAGTQFAERLHDGEAVVDLGCEADHPGRGPGARGAPRGTETPDDPNSNAEVTACKRRACACGAAGCVKCESAADGGD